MTATKAAPTTDLERLERLVSAVSSLRTQVAQRIVGQDAVVDGILTAILAGGHALLIGVPGLAKTLMVQTVAEALKLSFNRVQFTPDLMPSDITGTEIIEEDRNRQRANRYVRGPVFANVVLADEINRTPPKTQAALLQAMQEHKSRQRPRPSTARSVLRPRDPKSDRAGRHLSPPEAQLDRFMLELRVAYPSRSEEEQIVEQTTGSRHGEIRPALDAEQLLGIQDLVRRIPVSAGLIRAAVLLARMTRPTDADAPALVKEYVDWGAGPRASQYLVLGAKALVAEWRVVRWPISMT